jgi:hypothetical protein
MALNDLIVRLHLVGENRSAVDAMLETGEVSKRVSKDMESNFDKSTSRIGGLFTRLGQSAESMGTPFGKVLGDVGTKFEEAEKKGHGLLGVISGLGAAATGAGIAAFVGVAGESIKIALEGEAAQANLEVAIRNSGAAYAKVAPLINTTTDAMARQGFNAEQTNQALTSLITASGSTAKATSLMGQAADLARFKHISLSDAAAMLAKVLGGNTRIVKQLGLNLNVQAGSATTVAAAHDKLLAAETKLGRVQYELNNHILKGVKGQWALQDAQTAVTLAQDKYNSSAHATTTILDAISQKTGGAASAFSATLPGRMDAFNAQIHNLGDSLGKWLLPKLTTVAGYVSNFVNFLMSHKGDVADFGAAVGVIGTALAGIWAYNKVTGIFSAMKDAGGALKSVTSFGSGGAGAASSNSLLEQIIVNTREIAANTATTAAEDGTIATEGGVGAVTGAAGGAAGGLRGALPLAAGVVADAVPPLAAAYLIHQGMNGVINHFGGRKLALSNKQLATLSGQAQLEQQYVATMGKSATFAGFQKLVGGAQKNLVPKDQFAQWAQMQMDWDKSHKNQQAADARTFARDLNINVTTNASPQEIAAAVSRALRSAGAR